MTVTSPRGLRTDGVHEPLGIGRAPLLTWDVVRGQAFAHVVIEDDQGSLVWDSGHVPTQLSGLRADVDLTSRRAYRWQARVADCDMRWSPWSTHARWECPLLAAADWQASWIARPVDASRRVIRSLARGRIDWIGSGESLGQAFTATGQVTSVSVDLVGDDNVDVQFALELLAGDGQVVAVREVQGPLHLWDRFMHYIEVSPPAPAGSYTVRLRVSRGAVGWHTAPALPAAPDDGVSPLPVAGCATRNHKPEPGLRAVGVDTVPSENPLFRCAFGIDGTFRAARLYAVALGCGSFTLNGHKVGDELLEPAPTNFDRTILYRSWDVSELLRVGRNELVASVGRGHYAARGANVWGWHLAPWHREPTLIAQLEYLDEDGHRRVIGTGREWHTTAGPVTQDLLYSGETWLTQAESPVWEPAQVITPPTGILTPAPLPPIRAAAPRTPVSSARRGRCSMVYDFGEMITGRVRCTIRGGAQSSVRVSYGEELDAGGAVLCVNELAIGPAQVDVHQLETNVDRLSWEPQFGYRGFRFVEVQTTGDAVVEDVQAIPLHTAVQSGGAFSCDQAVLNKIDGALARTFLNNLHGIPTDTPVYEKNGWTADAHLATEAVLHQFDLRSTFGKWLDDHQDAQDDSGMVPQIVPSPGWGRGADPAWSGSAVLIAWRLYWEYGDLDILRRYAPMATRYADALLKIADGTIWPLRSWGDWLPPGHQMAPEGAAPTATMMMRSVLQHTAAILQTLNRVDQANEYTAAADRLAVAYHDAYFERTTGTYAVAEVGYRQTMNVLPLAFGAVPAAHVDAVVGGLVADLENRTLGHLDCGAIGVRYLLPVLTAHARDDLALTILTKRTRPGWGVWFEEGGTTLRESWDHDARSHNHYFLGSVASWIQQRVGGMRSTSPGWATFSVDPIVDERVGQARIEHRTVRGQAAVSWRHGNDDTGWEIEVTVPPGSTATLAPTLTDDRPILGAGQHRLHL